MERFVEARYFRSIGSMYMRLCSAISFVSLSLSCLLGHSDPKKSITEEDPLA